tara:strand:+ start:6408 stop:7019 length:612 start_codon:yes stop_codon:yes gene_type:complete
MSFSTVKKFEDEIAQFFGSPYAVAVDCCTHAVELCLRYEKPTHVSFPTRTYISIPFLGEKLGLYWYWNPAKWKDYYYIGASRIVDAAVLWKKNGYIPETLMCISFQYQKHLSLGRGGMILTDDKEAAEALKKMSYDGRHPDAPWREQDISSMGYHYYMTPETAQDGLDKLEDAKKRKPMEWAWKDWPDLRKMEVFKNEDYHKL